MGEAKLNPAVREVLTKAAARAMEEAAEFHEDPNARQGVRKASEKILYQDPSPVSKRVWSVALLFVSLVLMDPDVQQALLSFLPAFIPVQYLPAAGVILAAILTTTSKMLDPRLPRTAAGSAAPDSAQASPSYSGDSPFGPQPPRRELPPKTAS